MARDEYIDALKKRQERMKELEAFLGQTKSSEPKTLKDEALSEAAEAANILKAKKEEAKINKLARELNDSDYSDFNLKDPSNNDNYDDVLEQFGLKKPMMSKELTNPKDMMSKELHPSEMMSYAMDDQFDHLKNKQVPSNVKQNVIVSNSPTNTKKNEDITLVKDDKKEIDEDVEALKNAQRERDILNSIANITGGIQQATAAYSGGRLTNIKPELSMVEALKKQGELKVKDIEDIQKLKGDKKKDALNDLYKKSIMSKMLKESDIKGNLSDDPNSEQSKKMQEALKSAGYKEDLSGFSEADLKKNLSGFLRKTTKELDIDREKRLKEKQAWQVGEKDEVSDKQLESINSLNIMKEMANKAKQLKSKVNTGVYSQKMHEASRFLPFDVQNEDQAALTQIIGTNLADYIKDISGAAVSEQEAERLRKNLPTMNDDDKIFNRKMEEFQKILDKTMKTRIVNMKDYQGKYIPEDRMIKTDKVKIVLPNGKVGMIPQENLQKALERGAKLVE